MFRLRNVLVLIFVLICASIASAQSNPPLTIREVDGTPSKTNATALVFANGTLSISGGVVTFTGGGGGSGTVTNVSVVTANGVSGSVANSTTTPAITLTLGAITPTTVNGLTVSTTTGTLTITNGKVVSVSNTLTFTGTDSSSVAFGAGGTVLYATGSGTGLTFPGLLSIASGKTLTASNTLTFTGTDGSSVAFGTGGTVVFTARNINTTSPITGGGDLSADRTIACATCGVTGSPLSQFAVTTSAQFFGVISNETGGAGLAVGNSTPTIITPSFTTGFTIGGVAATGTIPRGDGTNFIASAFTMAAPGTSGNVLTSDGTNWLSSTPSGGGLTVGTTAVTSGTGGRVFYETAGNLLGEISGLTSNGSTTLVQTSNSATAFESGPNGSTNPVFRLVNSIASAATGLSITGNAAGSGVTLAALSSGAAEDLIINPKGAGNVTFAVGAGVMFNILAKFDGGGFRSLTTNQGMEDNVTRIGMTLGAIHPLFWTATTPTAAPDSNFSRISAGLIGVGSGSQGSFAGSLKLTDVLPQGVITQTSASATAFESGPNGSTNPVFRLVNNVASAATGLSITGNASGSGVTLTALGGTNEGITLVTKGTGMITATTGEGFVVDKATQAVVTAILNLKFAGGSKFAVNASGVVDLFGNLAYQGTGSKITWAGNGGFGSNSAGVMEVLQNATTGQWGALLVGTRDAGTATVTNGLTIGHQSTGTPAAGLGTAILFNINDTTTADVQAGQHYASWVDPAHATRTSTQGFTVVGNAVITTPLTLSSVGAGTPITGLDIKSNASAAGVTLTALGGTNEPITLTPKGTAAVAISRVGTAAVPALTIGATTAGFMNSGNGIITIASNEESWFVAGGGIIRTQSQIGFLAYGTTLGGNVEDVAIYREAAGILVINNGAGIARWGQLKVGTYDAGTTTTTTGLTVAHTSSGTPAAGLGTAILFNLKSSTTIDQNAAQITAKWTDATHATRTADLVFSTVNSAAALAEAFRITGAGGLRNPTITADTALTDTTVCQDTTNHQFYSGSGTLGTCLGTSTLRAKNNVTSLNLGLNELMKLKPISFTYRAGWGYDTKKTYYGFGAEDVRPILPNLSPLNAAGQPSSVDLLGMVPLTIRAIQEQQIEIEALKARIRKLETK